MSSTNRTQLRLQQITSGSVALDAAKAPSGVNTDGGGLASMKEVMDHMATAIKNIQGRAFHNTSDANFLNDESVFERVTSNGTQGPVLTLRHNQGTGNASDGDGAGTIKFVTLDSANNNQDYASVQGVAASRDDGNESGQLSFKVATTTAGNLEEVMKIVGGADAAGSTVTIEGNLDVNGTTTTIDTTNLTVKDVLIQLGEGNTGTAKDVGLLLTRGTRSVGPGAIATGAGANGDTALSGLDYVGAVVTIRNFDGTVRKYAFIDGPNSQNASDSNAAFTASTEALAVGDRIDASHTLASPADDVIIGAFPVIATKASQNAHDLLAALETVIESAAGHNGTIVVSNLGSVSAGAQSSMDVAFSDAQVSRPALYAPQLEIDKSRSGLANNAIVITPFATPELGNVFFGYDESLDIMQLGRTMAADTLEGNIAFDVHGIGNASVPLRLSDIQFSTATETIGSDGNNNVVHQAGAGGFKFKDPGTSAGDVPQLQLLDRDNGNFFFLQPNDSNMSADIGFVFPDVVGGPGQLLKVSSESGGAMQLGYEASPSARQLIVSGTIPPSGLPAEQRLSLYGGLGKISPDASVQIGSSMQVFVNGQLLLSGTSGEVTNGSADYFVTENTTQAEATIQVSDGDGAMGTNHEQGRITLISSDNTSRTYVIVDGPESRINGGGASDFIPSGRQLIAGDDIGATTLASPANDAIIGGIAVAVDLDGGTQNEFLVELKKAIESSSGHNGKILVQDPPAPANGNQDMKLIQRDGGTAGNQSTTKAGTTTNVSSATNFTGGAASGAFLDTTFSFSLEDGDVINLSVK